MPRSILPILCTLALVPALLWLGGADEIGRGLLQALPSGRIQQISLPDDGHALVTPAVLALVQNWLEKV